MKKPNGREGLPLAASDIEQEARKWYIENTSKPAEFFDHEDEYHLRILTAFHRHMLTKASTSEGDQLSEEDLERMADDGGYEKLPEGYGEGMKLARVDQRLCFMHGIRYARDHGLLSDPRRSKMVEAGNAMRDLLDSPWFPYEENRDKAIVAWDAAIGGEDGGGPLSGDGGGSLGASAETADRSTAFNLPEDGKDFQPPPLRADTQGPIDAVPAPKPNFKRTKP